MIRIHLHGATINRIPLTKEYSLHVLTEEPLTLFPDGVRCPPSTAFPLPIFVALPGIDFGSERELVGGGQGRERGT